MQQIQFGIVRGASICDFIDAAALAVDAQHWLFVAIDSSRGDAIARAGKHFSKSLAKQNIQSWSGPEGLWIPGKFLKDVCGKSNIIVPYSAAYIFDRPIDIVDPPKYTSTSESDVFSEGLPEILKMDLERFGAYGYVADGDGLNYAFRGLWADRVITSLQDIDKIGRNTG